MMTLEEAILLKAISSDFKSLRKSEYKSLMERNIGLESFKTNLFLDNFLKNKLIYLDNDRRYSMTEHGSKILNNYIKSFREKSEYLLR